MFASDLDTAPDIRSRLSAAHLPVMPQVLLHLLEHCQTDEIRTDDVIELLSKDVALTVKILDLAASRLAHQPASLEQAVTTLGPHMLRTLLMRESVSQALDRSPANDVDLRSFWKHSLTAAVAAQMIAAKIGYPKVEEAYLAGLLHDVGRLVLWATAPDQYAANIDARDDENLCAHERRTLHITHPQAGACLIARWEFDSFLADSVLYHHEEASRLERSHPLIRIGFLAHQLADDAQDDQALETFGFLCGVGPAVLPLIRGRAAARVEKTAAILGIELADGDKVEEQGSPRAASAQDSARERLRAKVSDLIVAAEAGRAFTRQEGVQQLLETVTQSARLLFGFEDAALFVLDDKTRTLNGAAAGQQRRRLAEFSIPLDDGGAIAAAALEARPTYVNREGKPLGIAEEQLLRILGAEHLVCLPLVAARRCRGVVIGAASSSQMPPMRRREGFLQAFGAQVAVALNTVSGRHDEAGKEVVLLKDKYKEAIRSAAHEVNNPLSIIKNYLSVLDRKLAKQEPVSGEISILHEEIDRVGQIINGLADLQPATREGATDVNRVVEDVVRLFRDTEYVPAAVKIGTRMQNAPLTIGGNTDTVKQILVNLLKNAVEALPGGGEITIGTSGPVNRDGMLYVELWIKDTGPGIPAEVMANLFSPTQSKSTKGGGHRGLGLSIVHGLVKQMQGFITCRSDTNGSAFEILFPNSTGLTPVERTRFGNPA
jgi:signal transduction histidine kinase/HD-like signal output (HDOD) protein